MLRNNKPEADALPEPDAGQAPIHAGTLLWVLLLIILWAANAVVVKVTIRDIPPLWAAFLRFAPALPCVMLFMRWNGSGFSLRRHEFFPVFLLGLLMALQLFTFNLGAAYTTGGRITLFIFSYPLLVPLLAPLFIQAERFEKRNLLGCLVAFAGLSIAFRDSLGLQSVSTLKGDVIEFISCLLIAVQIVYNKRLAVSINKWKLLLWTYGVMILFFFCGALMFEDFNIHAVRPDAWLALAFQSLVISVFSFMSWQYLIVRHNSSSLSVFFFATPLFGMFLGALLLNEAIEPGLVVACILVGFGIYIVNRKQRPV
ncbi:MAG: DMT family transporter [Thermodesulfobacteriota bacterium]